MGTSGIGGKRTRREFLTDTIRLGVAAVGAAALGDRLAPLASAQGQPVQTGVHLANVVQATPADFARGVGQGVQLVAEGGRAALRGAAGAEFTSGVVSLPFAATHLGLHWLLRDAPPEAVSAAVRTSADQRRWTAWYPLEVEAVGRRPSSGEVFASLAPGDGSAFVQYRLSFPGGQATVEAVTITAIDVAGRPADPTPGAELQTVTVTSPGGMEIPVVPRGAWGCDESLIAADLGEDRDVLWSEWYVPVKKVIIHHTATSSNYSDGAAEVRAVWVYHAITLGWGDIGYNVLVDKYGTIYEGRHGRGEDPSSREIFSADVTAGHCYYHNYGSTGISAIGNYQTSRPTTALLNALDLVTTFECERQRIDPMGVSDFLESTDVWHDGLNNISGHYESYATSCPGKNLKSYLPTLRSHVAAALSGWSASLSLSEMTGAPREVTVGSSVSFAWSGPVTEVSLEGWGKDPNLEPIWYISGYQDSVSYAGDPLAKDRLWQSAGTWINPFTFSEPGHYTIHVRGDMGAYEANLTFLVKPASSSDAPPTVRIVSPADGASVSAGDVTIQVAASDAEDAAGTLKVEVSIDGGAWALATYGTNGNYEYLWGAAGLTGAHTIDARATDSASNATNASRVTVTVGSTPSGRTVHIADLDGRVSTRGKSSFWEAFVTATVRDTAGAPVANATVTGSWSGDASGSVSGVTASDGTATLSTGSISGGSQVVFTVQDVSGDGLTYDEGANTDPDGDSSGTIITITK
ncbi:MAG: N-acetylmuramoyl-L-alanine amidase [Chloroflexota bacterium]